MELETAARRHLLNQTPIKNLVANRIWKFSMQLYNEDGSPKSLEGSGLTAIVVKGRGGWTKPLTDKTSEFPLLVIECWADHSRRDDDSMNLQLDGEDRAKQVFRVVDKVLHRPDREHQTWPDGDANGLYVEGSFRAREPDGPLAIDGAFVVRAAYDVKVFH